MDNRTYHTTDFSEKSAEQSTAQLPQTSAYTLPGHANTTDAIIVGAVEGLYDTVASEAQLEQP